MQFLKENVHVQSVFKRFNNNYCWAKQPDQLAVYNRTIKKIWNNVQWYSPLPTLSLAALTIPSRPTIRFCTIPSFHVLRFRDSSLMITTSPTDGSVLPHNDDVSLEDLAVFTHYSSTFVVLDPSIISMFFVLTPNCFLSNAWISFSEAYDLPDPVSNKARVLIPSTSTMTTG